MTESIKELIYNEDRSPRIVTFTHYFDGDLWYQTESGFKFPVPVNDIGNATFKATDHAPLFMRYIRKQLSLSDNVSS